MKNSDKAYRIIAISSLLILVAVQFKLIYNTYELRNNQYFIKEKTTLHDEYSQSVRNDKVFPGGQLIVDKYIYGNINALKKTYLLPDSGSFVLLKNKIAKGVMEELRAKQNMDSIFSTIVRKHNLANDLKYSLVLLQLSITFDGINYIPIIQQKEATSALYLANDAFIGGTLRHIDKQNKVSAYTVNSGLRDSYQIGFSLHVDRDNRVQQILKDMLITFLLTVGSIALVISIYYKTYKNWLQQKKLTAVTSDFLNSISHEFNTPVATILVANRSLNSAEIIGNPIKVKNLTAVIERQAQRLKKLINQSLMISKLSGFNLEVSNHDFTSLILESLADYSLKLDANISVIPDLEDDLPEISLNKFLFITMLYNILDNSIKYNQSDFKEIVVKLKRDHDFLVLSITDNGIGMNAETIKSIYKKFFRGKHHLQEEGLGLGLYYVHQVIKLHNWELKVSSSLEKGSTFAIRVKIMM